MKVLFSILMPYTKQQQEIVRSFLYYAYHLAKAGNNVTFLFLQKKKSINTEKWGITEQFKKVGVKVITLLDYMVLNDERMLQVDIKKIRDNVGKDYDKIFLLGHFAFSFNQQRGNDYFTHHFEELYYDNESFCNFNIGANCIKQSYLFYYLNAKFNIPVTVYVVDWLETDVNEVYQNETHKVSFYENISHNVKHNQMYEFYLFRKKLKIIKTNDFVFGYFNPTSCSIRNKLGDKINRAITPNDKVKLYGDDKSINLNNVLNQTEYFEEISGAKFSLIIPSMDINEFSLLRFYECIHRNCIPLIDVECNLKKAFKGKEDIVAFYKRNNLIIDINKDNINEITSSLNYDELIEEFNQLDSVNKLYSLSIEDVGA